MESGNDSQREEKEDCCLNVETNASSMPPCCQPQVNVRTPSMDFDGFSIDARRESVAVRQTTLKVPECCQNSPNNPYKSDTAVSMTSSTNKNRSSKVDKSKKSATSGSLLGAIPERSSRNLQEKLAKLADRYKEKNTSSTTKSNPVFSAYAALHSISIKSDTVSETSPTKNGTVVPQATSNKNNGSSNKYTGFQKKKKEKKAATSQRTLTLQESIKNFNDKRKSEKYSEPDFYEMQDNIQSFTDNENILTSSTPYIEDTKVSIYKDVNKNELNNETGNTEYGTKNNTQVLDTNKDGIKLGETKKESNFSFDQKTFDVKVAAAPTKVKKEDINNQVQSITIIKDNKRGISNDFTESFLGLANSSHTTRPTKNNIESTINSTTESNIRSNIEPTIVRQSILDCCIVNEEVLAPIKEMSSEHVGKKGKKDKTPNWAKGGNKYSNSRYQSSQRPYCIPTTCSHLNKQLEKAAWKNCCNQSKCPLNDPTTSTYKFLQKIKLCCNKRACHLASRICDIYEPLIQQADIVVSDHDAIGDSQYHYLFTDATTTYEEPTTERHTVIESEQEISSTDPKTKPELQDKSYLEEMKRVSEYENSIKPSSIDIKQPNEVEVRESIFIDPEEERGGRERRASTVSWSVPNTDDGSDADQSNAESTASQEKIVAEAMAAASKFRETPQPVKQTSIFGEIVRHGVEKDGPDTNVSFTGSQEMFFKSQLESGNMKDSKYRMKMGCCSKFLRKFKRNRKNKKNKTDNYNIDSEDEESGWQFAQENKKKRSNIGAPIQEKRQQINTMLNNM